MFRQSLRFVRSAAGTAFALAFTLALTAGALVGCSDAAPGQDDEDGSVRDAAPPAANADTAVTNPDIVPPGSRELVIQGQVNRLLLFGEAIDLQVKLVQGRDQAPVVNERLQANLIVGQNDDRTAQGVEGTGLRTTNATTDAQGLATFELRSRDDARAATFRVKISAAGAVEVYWNITATRPGSGGLIVRVDYDDQSNRYAFNEFGQVEVSLFDNTNCASLGRDPLQLPSAFLGLEAIRPFNEMNNTVTVSELSADAQFSIAAVGLSPQNNVIAFGCTDGTRIVGGDLANATVVLEDLKLVFKGQFLVENELHLTGLLEDPEDGNDTLAVVGRVLRIVAAVGGGVGDVGEEYPRGTAIVNEICELADLSDGVCRIIRTLAPSLVERVLDQYMPPEVDRILQVIGDIYRIVDNFTVIGEIEFTANYPNEYGNLIGNDNRWLEMRFIWRQGCPFNSLEECTRTFTLGELGVDRRVVAGAFNATVAGADGLNIEQHSLILKYGLIILGVAEQWIIPAILGSQDAVTLEDMLDSLIPCRNINESLFGDPGNGICEEVLVEALSTVIRDQLARLDLDMDQFTLEGNCRALDSDGDLNIDKLVEGHWDAVISVGGDDLTFPGSFRGCRRPAPGAVCEF